jgi:hypothetical protein
MYQAKHMDTKRLELAEHLGVARKEVESVRNQVNSLLTWKQYNALPTMLNNADWIVAVSKVSKSAKVFSLRDHLETLTAEISVLKRRLDMIVEYQLRDVEVA